MERKAIYVTTQGARVHRADGMVVVSADGRPNERFAPAEISRVLLFGNVQISTQALALLLREEAHVSFLSSTGRYRGQIVSPEAGNVFVRLAQHQRYYDLPFRLSLARDLVRGKLCTGREMLLRFARNHPEDAERMDRAVRRLDDALTQLRTASNPEVLLGIEGSAAAAYFEAFDRMVRPPFRFERRSKHPAHNPVNALLNLGYTLLAGEVGNRLEASGFDPRIGYYHGVRYGRRSLALDLMEVHRVDVIDRLTLSVLNRRMFVPGDFEDKGGEVGVYLKADALRRYVALYEATMGEVVPGAGSVRSRIAAQVDGLRQAVMAGKLADESARTEGGLGEGEWAEARP